jgi:hypothetical protein
LHTGKGAAARWRGALVNKLRGALLASSGDFWSDSFWQTFKSSLREAGITPERAAFVADWVNADLAPLRADLEKAIPRNHGGRLEGEQPPRPTSRSAMAGDGSRASTLNAALISDRPRARAQQSLRALITGSVDGEWTCVLYPFWGRRAAKGQQSDTL